jgi:hypothetical protein
MQSISVFPIASASIIKFWNQNLMLEDAGLIVWNPNLGTYVTIDPLTSFLLVWAYFNMNN